MNEFYIDDIKFESEASISAAPVFIEDIQSASVFLEDKRYHNYKITDLQIQVNTGGSEEEIQITIPFTRRMEITNAKYAKICYYDGVSQWRILDTTYRERDYTISAKASLADPILAIFFDEYFYSEYTQHLANEFPVWTAIRQTSESNGQQFLNMFGITLERMKDDLEEERKSKFIDLLNPDVLAWVYVCPLPNINPSDEVVFYDQRDEATRTQVPVLRNIRSFFYNITQTGILIDYESRRAYSLRKYDKMYGQVLNIDNRQEFESASTPHAIWNVFDEFGLLLGVKRLYLEDNHNYRERIKDVYRYPASGRELGLTHAIARELGMIQRFTWKDDTKNLVIKGLNLDVRTLLIDGKALAPNMVSFLPGDNSIVVQAIMSGTSHEVSIIKDIIKHELHNESDGDLLKMMYQDNGMASDKLVSWVHYINQVAPVMWGDFNWDEGYWDTIDKEATGLGYIPNMWDSNIDIWKDYTFRLDMNQEVKRKERA